MKVLVSACLLGTNCKYNGGNNYSEKLAAFLEDKEVIAVCPEVMGGLSIPRPAGEIVKGIVRSKEGISLDEAYHRGAEKALAIARKEAPDLLILQSRSPSCGVKEIYDGSFSGKKIPGQGVFASLALKEGFRVIDIADL